MSQVFRPLEPMVIVTAENGTTDIPSSTPLTRLHYFDGKFLRASDLSLEQHYMQALSNLSNQAGGTGVVHGFDTTLRSDGDEIVVGAGMAIDPLGRVLLLPANNRIFRISELIPLTARAFVPPRRRYVGPGSFEECVTVSETPASKPTDGFNFYLITIGHAEALCGQEDVYGKICEEACITSSDRPFFKEGVIVRAEPLTLTTGMVVSGVVSMQDRHLRSRLASAVFAMEDARVPTFVSGAGLNSEGWCLGARLGGGTRVPLAVIARMGSTTVFLDSWTVRRERMETPPKRYWAARLSMRPWDVFLAQVLQFQCHLTELLDETGRGRPFDPCRDLRDVVRDTVHTIGDLIKPLPPGRIDIGARIGPLERAQPLGLPLTQIADLHGKLDRFIKPGFIVRARNGVLLDGGIIELPPAGYLPVSAGQVVNDQIREMVGRGLDLRFCVVTADFVAHALEEAQHMDRISLLEGLEPGGTRPPVDVLIPEGELLKPVAPARGIGFEGELYVRPEINVGRPAPAPAPEPAPPIIDGPRPAPFRPGVFIPRAAIRNLGVADIAGIADRVRDSMDEMTGRLREIVILEPEKPRPTAGVVQVLGAGRAEAHTGGGGEFHFAGISEASHRLKIADFITGLAAIGRDAPDDLKVFQKLPLEDLSGPAGKIAPALYMRANMIGGTASLFSGGLRSKFPGAIDDILRPGFAELPEFEVPTPAAEKRLVSVWTSMRSDRNPFELVEDQSTRVDLSVTVGAPGKKPSSVDYRVQGDLIIAAIQRTGPITILKGFVHGGSAHTRAIIDGGAPVDYQDSGDIAVSCQLEDTGKQQKLTVRVRHGKLNSFRIDVSWGGAPLQAHVEVTYDRIGEFADTTLVRGTLLRNDAVLTPGHPRHALALSAVGVTGALLKRPEFSGRATSLLFPPAPPPPSEIRIRATRDWVMFHRRRLKNCAVAEAVAPAPARRYQLWQVAVPDAASADQLRTALLTNNPVGLPPFAPVTPIEFAPGVATLTSNADHIRHDWSRDQRGNILQYALIASHGTLDGDQIARARLAQVQATLQPGVMPDAQSATDVLSFVPSALSVPGTDGAILLITRSQVKTTCHNVYHIAPHYAVMAIQLIKDQQIVALANQRITSLLGNMEFKGDSADVITAPGDRQVLVNRWKEAGGGRIDSVFGFANASDAVASAEPHLTNRVKAIVGLLGNAERAVTANAITAPMPEGCNGATFVIPALSKHLVLVINKKQAIGGPRLEMMERADPGGRGGALADAQRLGEMTFVAGTSRPLGGDHLERLATLVPGVTAAQAVVLSRSDNGPESELTLQAQAKEIAEAIGVPGLAVAVERNVPAAAWPSEAYRHITVVLVQADTLTEHLVVAIERNPQNVTAGDIVEAINSGELDTVLKYGKILGEARFVSGTANAPAPLAVQMLTTAFPNVDIIDAEMVVFTRPGDNADAAVSAQADGIKNAVGGATMDPTLSAVAARQWPAEAAASLHISVIALLTRPRRRVGPFDPRLLVVERRPLDRDVLDPTITNRPVVRADHPIRTGPQGGRSRARKKAKKAKKVPDK